MKFQLPDQLPDSVEDLKDLRTKAIDAFEEASPADDADAPSQEDLDYLRSIVDAIHTIDGRIEDIAQTLDRAQKVEDLHAEFEEVRKADAQDQQPAAAEDTADNPGDDDVQDTPVEKAVAEKEAVAASAATGRVDFRAAASASNPDVPAPTSGYRLTTSARNYESGLVDAGRVAEEFCNLAGGSAARVIGLGGRSETTFAYVERGVADSLRVSDQASAIRALETVTDESRLPGGSLVAAGGWCSPSETVYDFLPTEQAGDLLSLPEITMTRGGIRFPHEPDFSALYTAAGFTQTEAQAQAGTEKTCYEIPCAEFEEVRLDAVGICITSGILQDKAWPELTRKYVEEAIRVSLHRLNAYRVGKIVAGSTDLGALTGPHFGTAGAVLSALELQVADMRARHRIPRSRSVEGMAPVWLLSILRADLAYRDEVLPERVTDAHIIEHFRDRGANIQFISDWQNEVIGAETPAAAWPTEVKVALWPAGTWWSAVEPVINLGITHDSTMLKKNRQIQLFTEDGVAVGKRGVDSRVVTIPVSVDGTVGARFSTAASAASVVEPSDSSSGDGVGA